MAFTYQQAIDLLYATELSSEGADPTYGPPKIFEEETIERDWGWVFFYNSEMYYKTRIPQYAAIGIGPLFFNRETGEIRHNSTGRSTESLILEYEEELLAGDKHWCLFIDKGCDRAKAVVGLKKLLEVPTSTAFNLLGHGFGPVFTGKRLDLEWMRKEMEQLGVMGRLELVETEPTCTIFDADGYDTSGSIANAYHRR
jgi:hypothetical protein